MSPSTAWSEIVGKLAAPKSCNEVDATAHSLHESVAAIYSDYKDTVKKPHESGLPIELAELKEVVDASGKVSVRTGGWAYTGGHDQHGSGGEECLPEV